VRHLRLSRAVEQRLAATKQVGGLRERRRYSIDGPSVKSTHSASIAILAFLSRVEMSPGANWRLL
jgi:hypothetical protein